MEASQPPNHSLLMYSLISLQVIFYDDLTFIRSHLKYIVNLYSSWVLALHVVKKISYRSIIIWFPLPINCSKHILPSDTGVSKCSIECVSKINIRCMATGNLIKRNVESTCVEWGRVSLSFALVRGWQNAYWRHKKHLTYNRIWSLWNKSREICIQICIQCWVYKLQPMGFIITSVVGFQCVMQKVAD